jgi:hypothetical protein
MRCSVEAAADTWAKRALHALTVDDALRHTAAIVRRPGSGLTVCLRHLKHPRIVDHLLNVVVRYVLVDFVRVVADVTACGIT